MSSTDEPGQGTSAAPNDAGRVHSLTQQTRGLQVFIAVLIVASVLGYFSGLRDSGQLRSYRRSRTTLGATTAEPAPTYREQQNRRGNRLRHGDNLVAMESLRPTVLDPVPPVDDAARAAALAQRATRRAYNGAPPVIPHAIDQGAYPNCITCHEHGLRVGNRVASVMPHPRLENCYQCHVVSENPAPGMDLGTESPPFRDNGFVGIEPTPGERAWAGAPPVIPHPTLMRSECSSCHGVFSQGIRSTHPWRQQCVQCHGVSAALDQRPRSFEGVNP